MSAYVFIAVQSKPTLCLRWFFSLTPLLMDGYKNDFQFIINLHSAKMFGSNKRRWHTQYECQQNGKKHSLTQSNERQTNKHCLFFSFKLKKRREKKKIDDDNKSALNQLPNRNLIAIINARWRYGSASELTWLKRTNNRSFGFHLRCHCFVIDLFFFLQSKILERWPRDEKHANWFWF